MKTTTIPSVRVAPELRDEVERLLGDGETLSQFVEQAVRDSVMRRKAQGEFVERGMKSLALAKASGEYFDAATVMQRLRGKLDAAKTRRAKSETS
ncbi:YlcI/YnfO family protein [Variovorax sp. OV329]|uniref:YlcI/YnfO family protein n=1 Tax=Variovorax sp. OV329 TaxID=1882825 RepID=UPI0008ED2840|nr:YlcI/YnfO family protein [Variovorax sp. OV329]SFM56895.1 hypothetical protein SAMN05444747_106257 [Variovorax sp. OV329]